MQERKTTRKLIEQVAEIIKQAEAESKLGKQLLGNFQTDNLFKYEEIEAEVKNRFVYKKNVYCNDRINNIYQHLDGTIIQTVHIVDSPIIKHIHIF